MGPWCFADHIGPVDVNDPTDAGIGPHPHIGLQTVTWLLDGELRHLDSIGSDQVVRPGQLNLMTAGNGVVHAEEWHGGTGDYHGIQLWVAQPESTRHGDAAFEHHGDLPRVDLPHAVATVLVGTLASATSPARCDTDHFGAELDLRAGTTVVPLRPEYEHAVIVLAGSVDIVATARVSGARVEPGSLAYLQPGCEEISLAADAAAVAMLIGGEPFEARVSMWWNFVGRNHDELTDAQRAWNDRDGRFGAVESTLSRIPAPDVPWRT